MESINWNMVTALATIVYVIGTFLLWWVTCKSLQITRDAFKLNFLLGYLQTAFPQPPSADRHPALIAGWMGVDRKPLIDLIKQVFPSEFESLVNLQGRTANRQQD